MKATISCRIQGKAFSPSLAEKQTHLFFDEKTEVGDIAKFGRYKGRPTPYGACVLFAKGLPDAPYGQLLEQMIGTLEKHVETLRTHGADDFVLHMTNCYDAQCNLEFSPSEMGRLAELGIPFAISCYQSEQLLCEV